jgi:alkylhydroperoxidase family enzyme
MKGQSKRRMSKFAIHTHESAPPDSKPLMQGLEQAFGFVPNVSAVLAESPATLKAYMTLSKIFDESAFTPAERQVVILAINEYNECHYCVAAHSVLADTPLDEAFTGAAWKPGG